MNNNIMNNMSSIHDLNLTLTHLMTCTFPADKEIVILSTVFSLLASSETYVTVPILPLTSPRVTSMFFVSITLAHILIARF